MSIDKKTKVFNLCVIPSLTYAAQTWSLTNTQKSSLKVTYYKMPQNILNIKIKDKVRLIEIHEKIKARDIEWVIKKLKLSYAAHLVRGKDKWKKIVEEWLPSYWKRKKGRPPRRWWGKLVKEFGVLWGKTGSDRVCWRKVMEANARSRVDSSA